MIQAYKATYIAYEEPTTKQNQDLLVIEVIKTPINCVVLIDENGLFAAHNFISINAIKGYHHYTTPDVKDSFGIGGLVTLDTKSRPGMFESLSEQTGIPFKTIATAYGTALLQL
ncbi:MAG: hypothetical protein PF505_03305 [Vallitaleaceae bacterium]|jgi:hypothetical protein|nr:hypothetical protein [Vallitaleaceae bacterium]